MNLSALILDYFNSDICEPVLYNYVILVQHLMKNIT